MLSKCFDKLLRNLFTVFIINEFQTTTYQVNIFLIENAVITAIFFDKGNMTEDLIYLVCILTLAKVLYMSFDKFLLAVESRDLSQADKSIIRVSSFSILQNFTVVPK